MLNKHKLHSNSYTLLYYSVSFCWWRGGFAWWRVGWWRGGILVASWLVAKLPGGEMTGNRTLLCNLLQHPFHVHPAPSHMISNVQTRIILSLITEIWHERSSNRLFMLTFSFPLETCITKQLVYL